MIDRLFRVYRDGFYVYAKHRVLDPRQIAVYIGRYLCHPVIAGSRISDFDVETNMVTCWFVDENKVKQFVMLSAFEFIDRLVRLIADKNLKLIRYYGLCSRCTMGRIHKVFTCFSREKVSVVRKRVVVCCPSCGKVMDLVCVSRPDDGGLVYVEGDDDYASWNV